MTKNKIRKQKITTILSIVLLLIFFRYILTPISEADKVISFTSFKGFLFDIVIFIAQGWLVTTGVEFMSKKMYKKAVDFKSLVKLCIAQGVLVLSGILFIVVLSVYATKHLYFFNISQWLAIKEYTFVFIWITIIVLAIEMSRVLVQKWKESVLHNTELQKDALYWQLTSLRMQLDPHFMFNNYSVLQNLITKDYIKAVSFLEKLSIIHQYVQTNLDTDLVKLKKEILFIQDYIYLMKIRFGDSVRIGVNIVPMYHQKLIPPLTLQLLIENALKHNKVSVDQPLLIEIYPEEEYLIVKNNLQVISKKANSLKIGLNNIDKRYQLLLNKQVIFEITEDSFIVKLPLL